MTVSSMASDSTAQSAAEREIVAAYAAQLGVELEHRPPRHGVGGDKFVRVDACAADGSLFVEVFARQGRLRGVQLKKVAQDILKLALLRRQAEHAGARGVLLFTSSEARASVTGWLRHAADEYDVELAVVDISDELRAQIVASQQAQHTATTEQKNRSAPTG